MRLFHHCQLRTALVFVLVSLALAQQGGNDADPRPVKVRVEPVYPQIARQLKLRGTVQLQATVSPDGAVKEVIVVGGHPLLAQAASRAVMQWRYQAAGRETAEHIKINFGD